MKTLGDKGWLANFYRIITKETVVKYCEVFQTQFLSNLMGTGSHCLLGLPSFGIVVFHCPFGTNILAGINTFFS